MKDQTSSSRCSFETTQQHLITCCSFWRIAMDEEAAHIVETGMMDGTRDATDIALSNLDPDGVHQMVTSILGSSAKASRGRALDVRQSA